MYVKESKQIGGRLCRRPLDDMNENERCLSHEFLEQGLGDILRGRQSIYQFEGILVGPQDRELTRFVEIEPSIQVVEEQGAVDLVFNLVWVIGDIEDFHILCHRVFVIHEDSTRGEEDFMT